MTPPHGVRYSKALTDTGENDAVPDDFSTEDLARMAESPASELFVVNEHRKCWVKRWVRKMRLKMAFALGVVFAIQVGGVVAMRAVVESVTRKAVIEVLREQKLIALEPVNGTSSVSSLSVISAAQAASKTP